MKGSQGLSREQLEYWQRQMRSAPSQNALLEVVGKYLATLSHDQISTLPEGSRPRVIHQIDDVAALNVQVARDELVYAGDEQVAALLRQMVVVLTEATHRISQFSIDAHLLRPPRDGDHSGS
jgi:hypothetical protein